MSKRHFLEFEQPIAELDSKIEELRYVQNESAVDISDEIERLCMEADLRDTPDRRAEAGSARGQASGAQARGQTSRPGKPVLTGRPS